jgi:hypothetical protein
MQVRQADDLVIIPQKPQNYGQAKTLVEVSYRGKPILSDTYIYSKFKIIDTIRCHGLQVATSTIESDEVISVSSPN